MTPTELLLAAEVNRMHAEYDALLRAIGSGEPIAVDLVARAWRKVQQQTTQTPPAEISMAELKGEVP